VQRQQASCRVFVATMFQLEQLHDPWKFFIVEF
jgi:hypothetical protein